MVTSIAFITIQVFLVRNYKIYSILNAAMRLLFSIRTFLTPTIYSESGGLYVGLDGNIHNVTAERLQKYYSSDSNAVDVNSLEMQYFSDLSLWDTFRSHIPYQLLTAPSAAVGLMRTLDEMTRQYGYFPRWPLATAESGCNVYLL